MKDIFPYTCTNARYVRSIFICCMLVFVSACETIPQPSIDATLIPASHKREHQDSLSRAKACPLHLEALVDARASKNLLIDGENISQEALYALLQQSLFDMNVSPDNTESSSVTVSLQRAFVKSLGNNVVATVIVNVQYKASGTTTYSPAANYRGQSTLVKHNSDATGENDIAEKLMSKAIQQVTQRIKSSLLHQCEEAAVTDEGI